MSCWQSKASYGYDSIEEEFEALLRSAFVEHRAGHIALHNKPRPIMRANGAWVRAWESVFYGQEKGWLGEGQIIILDEHNEVRFRLTPEGRKHFGVKEKVA